jgi:hypothetical protein
LSAVQGRNGSFRFRFIGHLHEGEAARTACFAIGLNAYPLNLAVRLK